MTRNRLTAVDAARGAAMLFVCFAHFCGGYFLPLHADHLLVITDRIGMVASPTFMIVSGSMLGLLFARNPSGFTPIRNKLIDRGLFLLIIGHVVIAIAHSAGAKSLAHVARWGFITDAIGVALVFGPLLITRLSATARVLGGIGLFAISWLLVYAWHPHLFALQVLKEAFVGPDTTDILSHNFPYAQWFALYLASTAFGEWLARRAARGELEMVPRVAIVAGVVGVGLASVLHVIGHAFVMGDPTSPLAQHIGDLATPFQKLPPGPVYMLTYGGIGLLMTALIFALDQRGLAPRALGWLRTLGRTSLFVFILQYYLYFLGLYLLKLPYTPAWPLYYAASLVLIAALAQRWDRHVGQRFITVGFAAWSNRRAARGLPGGGLPPMQELPPRLHASCE